MNQHTLKKSYEFKGKGLHTGVLSTITICPAPENSGIRFQRTDLGEDAIVRAIASNVSDVSFNTTLEENGVKVVLVEHVLSAIAGLGIDNALIKVDNIEVPVLDGSAKPYVDAIGADGLQEQDAPRRFFEVKEAFTYQDDRSDAWVRVEPCERFEARLTIDFNSSVVGVQTCGFTPEVDYCSQIAPCRTFCFFSQLEQLAAAGLVKGGDMDNAIVIVDREVDAASVERVAKLFNAGGIEVRQGYLSNVDLHFDNECARHKMLDLIGDFSLLGAPLKAKITAMKTGHRVNNAVARILLKQFTLNH
ncbi:MAG: UDP-3-O-[3-hydroxymyristoyl] N-acetylglucosamine deacetylase [Bacteroidales bacterium]|nr:UDP-3-O-[3-hydroxymyristoyl] N-acetylglucosamine deacetylase [Bacteroidales bacterium]